MARTLASRKQRDTRSGASSSASASASPDAQNAAQNATTSAVQDILRSRRAPIDLDSSAASSSAASPPPPPAMSAVDTLAALQRPRAPQAKPKPQPDKQKINILQASSVQSEIERRWPKRKILPGQDPRTREPLPIMPNVHDHARQLQPSSAAASSSRAVHDIIAARSSASAASSSASPPARSASRVGSNSRENTEFAHHEN